MLAVQSLRSCKDGRQSEMELFGNVDGVDEFPDFSMVIDFDDLFVGINDEDVLPDLEMDPEILAEFSLSGGEESDMNSGGGAPSAEEETSAKWEEDKSFKDSNHISSDALSGLTQAEDDFSKSSDASNPSHKAKKTSKNSQGKRKVKVDWTPELHRRFVQAVEQLGVDKAVPSRILELMGIDCLTRHNIASHLQKYRSHRKHLLAREAEAANWTQRRHVYSGGGAPGGAAAAAGAAVGKRSEMSPWVAPTMGFPPMAPVPHFRPLHVWGHPSVDHSLMPPAVWPKHLGPSPAAPMPHSWPPAAVLPALPPPHDPSFWHSQHQRVPNSLTPGTPCFPPHLGPTRFPSPPVPVAVAVAGIPPSAMYKVDPAAATTGPLPHPPIDFHPSKESIDAAIGDVLSQPWQPLPLGLKPPSVDGVMVELQRQGISKIPPTSTAATCV